MDDIKLKEIKFAKTHYCSSFLRTPITPSIPSTAESSKQLAQARLTARPRGVQGGPST